MNFPWIPNHAYWAHKSLRLRTHLRLRANRRKRQQSMGFPLLKPKPWIHIPDVLLTVGNILMHENFIIIANQCSIKVTYFAWMHILSLLFLDRSWEFLEAFLTRITIDWIRCFRSGRVFFWCADSLYFDLRFKLQTIKFTERPLSWETLSIVRVGTLLINLGR